RVRRAGADRILLDLHRTRARRRHRHGNDGRSRRLSHAAFVDEGRRRGRGRDFRHRHLAQPGQERNARGLNRISTTMNGSSAMNLPTHLLPTTVVGSYPQPDWLVDHAMLSKSVPRTRMRGLWRLPEEHLEEAQNDATIVAIRDMERAGIDIVTDGEIRRE